MSYWIPVSEAARLARLPARTLYDWIQRGDLTSVRAGKPERAHVDYERVCCRMEQRGPGKRLLPLRHLT